MHVIQGILIPFLGTCSGAACVLFLKCAFHPAVHTAMNGFAAGVMVAASIWGLLIPAMEFGADMGRWLFVPAVAGFWLGILFLLLLDRLAAKLEIGGGMEEGAGACRKTTMLVLAVTLHNIPEGLAVGVAFAGFLSGEHSMTLAGAVALAAGIAIQNVPEGAIVSLPLKARGMSRPKAFLCGVLSGVVEPVFAAAAVWAAGLVVPAMPYLLSFAAGAMIYVVVAELLPGQPCEKGSAWGSICFAAGFTLMLALDVALG